MLALRNDEFSWDNGTIQNLNFGGEVFLKKFLKLQIIDYSSFHVNGNLYKNK